MCRTVAFASVYAVNIFNMLRPTKRNAANRSFFKRLRVVFETPAHAEHICIEYDAQGHIELLSASEDDFDRIPKILEQMACEIREARSNVENDESSAA
jgi:hypothetical protein